MEVIAGIVLAVTISTLTAPVGVSGAVFLVPAQLGVLGTPALQVTPTNLIYNVIAIPGALVKFARAGSLWNPLTRFLLWGAAPGMVIGAVIRSQLLASTEAFHIVIAAVLLPLGFWMFFFGPPTSRTADDHTTPTVGIIGFALIVGVIGGIYGIGGGSILAPILVGLGYRVALVAPAALTSTFATSVIGIAAFAVIGMSTGQDLLPDWSTGIALGLGGLVGSYIGATIQPRVSERLLRKVLGLLAAAIAITYAILAAT